MTEWVVGWVGGWVSVGNLRWLWCGVHGGFTKGFIQPFKPSLQYPIRAPGRRQSVSGLSDKHEHTQVTQLAGDNCPH